MRTWVRHILRAAVVAAPVLAAACQSLHTNQTADCEDGECGEVPHVHRLHEPTVASDPTVMALAHDLDHLERHIDWYGSVVAKVPDVWGQARLTQYREDFEYQMKGQLGAFAVKLNGSLSRTDQSYFAYAQTLSLAMAAKSRGGGGAAAATAAAANSAETTTTQEVIASGARVGNGGTLDVRTPGGAVNVFGGQSPTGGFVNLQQVVPVGGATGAAPAPAAPPTPAAPAATPTNPAADPAGILAGGAGPVITRNGVTTKTVGFGSLAQAGIGLEPTIELAQRQRYLNFLNQLRRENEGDDTADAPGYSLNLIRIPVSVLPGKKTDVGYGAEITMTLTPVLGDDLLPMTFRNLVVNDLVAHLGFPLVKFLEDRKEAAEYLTDENRKLLQRPHVRDQALSDRQNKLQALIQKRIVVPTLSFSNGLNNRLPFPVSQAIEVYGLRDCFEIAYQANRTLGGSIEKQKYVHLPDVQGFLREELTAAYQFLAQPANAHLWAAFCTPDLVAAVRSRRYTDLLAARDRFRDEVQRLTGSGRVSGERPDGVVESDDFPPAQQYTLTAALAWCVIVDSALLTDRLARDMRETASAKGRPLAGCDAWCPYYLPDPPPECRAAFNAYVALRWPIHVFALDPYTQQQNLADTLSTRREMQLALSVAFTQGAIGSRQMMQYARRLEAEYETIALNNTQVGFSHGENVFGWRFYPRFQTPDTESNLTVLIRDTFIGGPNRNALLRQRRLEPGMRECVAVVMMPSFVPYATVDTVSNWFPLPNPKHKVLDHAQAMRLSHTVQAIRAGGCGVRDAGAFRGEDLGILLRRVEQLEARLPTQTLTTPVPVLNTLGGFQMFSNGTTDLAPELYGWYGAPGLDPTTDTTLFLVGDHFSPLRTKVIVGNKAIPDEYVQATGPDGTVKVTLAANKRMLSRQVMQVTVPAGAFAVDGEKVRVHVATPYGVTRELEIPVALGGGYKKPAADDKPKAAEGYTLTPTDVTLPYCKAGAAKEGKYFLMPTPVPAKTAVVIGWADALGTAPAQLSQVEVKFPGPNNCPVTVKLTRVFPYSPADGGYVLTSADLYALAAGVFNALNPSGPFTDATNPVAPGLAASEVTVTPLDPLRVAQPVKVAAPIKLKFECGCTVEVPLGPVPPNFPPVVPMVPPPVPLQIPNPPPAPKPEPAPKSPESKNPDPPVRTGKG